MKLILCRIRYLFVIPILLSIYFLNYSVVQAAPTITSVSPSSQFIGGTVTITGENFSGSNDSVIFTNNITANISTENTTSITCTVPEGASDGPVIVKDSSGTPSDGLEFTIERPTINQIVPNRGDIGDEVIITGTGFSDTSTKNQVFFTTSGNGTVEADIKQAGTTQLAVTVPVNAVSGPVKVTSYGYSTGVKSFITENTPTITAIVPSSGGLNNSIPITITGETTSWNRASQLTVTIAPPEDITINDLTVNSDTEITATLVIAGTASTGNRNITVTADSSVITLANAFTVLDVGISISPSSAASGGSPIPITITGSNTTWSSASQVAVSFSPATGITVYNIKVNSNTQITATLAISGDASDGGKTVTVTADNDVVTSENGFFVGTVVPTLSEWGIVFLLFSIIAVPAFKFSSK